MQRGLCARESCSQGAHNSSLEGFSQHRQRLKTALDPSWSDAEPFAGGREQGGDSGFRQEANVTLTRGKLEGVHKGTVHKGVDRFEGTSQECAAPRD